MPLSAELEIQVAPAKDVVTRDHEGGLIAVNLSTGFCWEMNTVGGDIWRQLAAGKNIREIAQGLGEKYGVSALVIEKDGAALLRQLLEAGLVMAQRPEGQA